MICAKIQRSKDECRYHRRIGGSRWICMKIRGHHGACGNWKLVSQPEHAHINDPKPKE